MLNEKNPNFDINFDPKTAWALKNIHLFPVEINRASYEMLIRVPGIGIKSAKKIISTRKVSNLRFEDLKKLNIVLKRAQYFITCNGKYFGDVAFDDVVFDDEFIKRKLTATFDLNKIDSGSSQISFFDVPDIVDDKHTSILGQF